MATLNNSETILAELHRSRFTNTTGSSQLEVNVCILLCVCFNTTSILLSNFVFHFKESSHTLRLFIFEFFICIFPLIISLTVLSDYIYFISIFFFIAYSIVSFLTMRMNSKHSWQTIPQRALIEDNRLSCVSHFRGVVNLYSVICILCADFNCFPRRFLKTEFHGYSLMDVGVGLFVIAFAFGSNHFKSKQNNWETFLKPSIFLIIGVARYLSVHSINYNKQVFEYGIHWNFFITLAALVIFNDLLFRILKSLKSGIIFSICLLILYEISLNLGLKDWIFGDSLRTNFVSANKEGIFSTIGYEVLYLWGLLIQSYLPKKGDSFQKYIKVLLVYSFSFITFLIVNFFCDKYIGVSRRCANSCYVFWIVAIFLIGLSALIYFELLFLILKSKLKLSIDHTVPFIVKSVNFNGLLFFLVGNLLTGLINLSINTLLVNNFWSVIILTVYIFICCSLTSFLYVRKWRIR